MSQQQLEHISPVIVITLRSIHHRTLFCQSCPWRRSNSIRDLRLHIRNHAQQILNDLIPRLAPCLLDLFHLLVCIFTGVFFCFLVAACVLSNPSFFDQQLYLLQSMGGPSVCGWVEWESTFFSNSLNSSSFCFRYSSISFCASFLASLTRFDRSGVGIRRAGDQRVLGGGDFRRTFSGYE